MSGVIFPINLKKGLIEIRTKYEHFQAENLQNVRALSFIQILMID